VSIISKIKKNFSDWFHRLQKKSRPGQKYNFAKHDEILVQKLNAKKRLPSREQLAYSYKYLSPRERIIIRILFGFIIICLIGLGLNIYWTNSSLLPKKGGIYSEGLIGSPRYINPLFAVGNDVDLDLTTLIYSGLFKFTKDGIVPDLAESFEVNPEQKIYTIKLRPNVFFHDNESLNADDVIFTFGRIQNQRSKSPLYFTFQSITIEKIDDLTIKFTLPEPFAPFLESLTIGILPEHVWKNIEPDNMLLAEYNLKPIGSGPFSFLSLTKSSTGKVKNIKLKGFTKFYIQEPFIDEIDVKFYESFDSAVEALNNKKIDGLSYLPKELRARIINNRNINFNLLHLPQYTAIFFNYEKNPILKDLKIRQNLSKGIDKQKIINEVLNAEAEIIDGPILPGFLGYTSETKKYSYDVLSARQELENAGWKLSEYSATNTNSETTQIENSEVYPYLVRKNNNQYMEFTLTTVNQPEITKVAKEVQKSWRELGIKVNLRLVNSEEMNTVISTRDYEALLYGQILGFDPDPYPFWHSSQKTIYGLNLSSFSSPESDKLLEDARKTVNETERGKKYESFQKIIADNLPAIFLYNPTYTYPQNKILKGFNNTKIIAPANRLLDSASWYIKTKRVWNK